MKNTGKFQEWSDVKINLDKKKNKLNFKERDVIFISIGKNIGYEILGKGEFFLRPVLILKKFNQDSFLGIPLTSQEKKGKYYYKFLSSNKKNSFAILSQVRYFDAKRIHHKLGMVPINEFYKIGQLVSELFPKKIADLTSRSQQGRDPEGIITSIIPPKSLSSIKSTINPAYILDNAEKNPEKIGQILSELHQKGETPEDLIAFISELNKRKILVKIPENSSLKNQKIFDICGTGGTGKSRINLSTALAIKLSRSGFNIAKHGNKAASGRVGSFDLIGNQGLEISDTPEKVLENLEQHNLAFIFAPAFHPSLKALAPIRAKINHPTIFNYLGPLLNPLQNITAQMVGVSSPELLKKLSIVAQALNKNILFVHDKKFGLDDVSIGGETIFTKVKNGKIESGSFFPEDYGLIPAKNFKEISGGNVEKNGKIFQELIQGIATIHQQNLLEINARVASEFFGEFL